jgi:hypothetical protein
MNPDLEKFASGPSPLSRLIGEEPRPFKVIPFPGSRGAAKQASVGLWNLMDHETRQARIEAVRYLTDVCKLNDVHLLQDTSLATEETTTQILWRALRDPAEPMRPFAASPNELRVHLTADEREALYQEYLAWVDERSPLRKIRGSEELEELVVALGKASTAGTLLSYYDSTSLRVLAAELAARCGSLTRLLSSAGIAPGDSPLATLATAPTGD